MVHVSFHSNLWVCIGPTNILASMGGVWYNLTILIYLIVLFFAIGSMGLAYDWHITCSGIDIYRINGTGICSYSEWLIFMVHPRKLTWHPKIDTWKRRFLLETIILRFHVSFRECKSVGKGLRATGRNAPHSPGKGSIGLVPGCVFFRNKLGCECFRETDTKTWPSFGLPSLKLTVSHGKSSILMVFTRKHADFHGRAVSFREGM